MLFTLFKGKVEPTGRRKFFWDCKWDSLPGVQRRNKKVRERRIMVNAMD